MSMPCRRLPRSVLFSCAAVLAAGCPDPSGESATGDDVTATAGSTTTADTNASTATTTETTTTGTAADSATTTGSTSGGTTTTTSTTGSSDSNTTDGGGPPILEPDIVPIFEKTCGALDIACHARVAYAADAKSECRGWLALEDEPLGSIYYNGPMKDQPTGCPDLPLFERLTTLDAWQCEAFDPRVRYVIPCDPAASYLVRKIDGGPYCKDGMGMITQAMPPGVQMDPGEIALIKAWIAAGAPTLADPDGVDCDDPPPDPDQLPVAEIWHPGDGEVRKVNVDIPWIGAGSDMQDGTLTGASLVWSSDLEGTIGQGEMFSAPLTMVGTHTITLTATDSDDNVGVDMIMLTIEP